MTRLTTSILVAIQLLGVHSSDDFLKSIKSLEVECDNFIEKVEEISDARKLDVNAIMDRLPNEDINRKKDAEKLKGEMKISIQNLKNDVSDKLKEIKGLNFEQKSSKRYVDYSQRKLSEVEASFQEKESDIWLKIKKAETESKEFIRNQEAKVHKSLFWKEKGDKSLEETKLEIKSQIFKENHVFNDFRLKENFKISDLRSYFQQQESEIRFEIQVEEEEIKKIKLKIQSEIQNFTNQLTKLMTALMTMNKDWQKEIQNLSRNKL